MHPLRHSLENERLWGCTWFPWHKVHSFESNTCAELCCVEKGNRFIPTTIKTQLKMYGLLDDVQVVSVTLCCSVCPKSLILRGCFVEVSQILSQFRRHQNSTSAQTHNVFSTEQSPKGHLGETYCVTQVCTCSTQTGT